MTDDAKVVDLPEKVLSELDAAVSAGDHLRAVLFAAGLVDAAQAALRGHVSRARENGATWDDIAHVLGITKQGAFQRFGRRADRAEEPTP